MIGATIVTLLALFFYFTGKKAYSVLCFLSLLFDGFQLLPLSVLGNYRTDFALIYIFIVLALNFRKEKYFSKGVLALPIWLFIGFWCCSFIFSVFYYHIPFIEAFRGGRRWLLILAYFFLIDLKWQDIRIILRVLYKITIITSILYLLQVATGHLLLANYGNEIKVDESVGLKRFYNQPHFVMFFLCFIVADNKKLFKHKNLQLLIYVAVVIIGLTRSAMAITLFILLLLLYLKGDKKQLLKYACIIGITIIPFWGLIQKRFVQSEASTDIRVALQGRVDDKEGGNLTYRLAWVMERGSYLLDKTFAEKCFGLGFLHENSKLTRQRFNFIVGLKNEETGYTVQLTTSDIAWGVFVVSLGFLGTLFWLYIVFSIGKFFYIGRKNNPLCLAAYIYLLYVFLISFFSVVLSNPATYSFLFIIMAYVKNMEESLGELPYEKVLK